MLDKQILVYIEGQGGGSPGARARHRDGEFRKAWKTFLEPLAKTAWTRGITRFTCIPGRGGEATKDSFLNPLPAQKGALRILLVDSEGPVSDISKPWSALGMKCPKGCGDSHCYLMVQCLETWLLADPEALERHYRGCFKQQEIKKWPNLEACDRKVVQKCLEEATKDCSRPYHHADGNLLIEVVERSKVRQLPSANRIFVELEKLIEEYASDSGPA